jgi:uncharacterized membrane protein (UPF0127 family)/CheY-like chemotaxis protein
MRGLLGRRDLPRGEGLLLRPAPSVHTFFMRFTIDVVFLDWDLQILRVVPKVRPFRIASCRPARTVLELAEGEIERLQLEPGQRLELLNEAGDVLPTEEAATRRPRVMLASTDSRFVSVTSFLLTRNGYEVETTHEPASVVATVEEAEPDVVVIDASDGTIGALRSVAALEALYRRVGVVVVADATDAMPLKNMHVLDKWSTFERLRARIADVAPDSARS